MVVDWGSFTFEGKKEEEKKIAGAKIGEKKISWSFSSRGFVAPRTEKAPAADIMSINPALLIIKAQLPPN